MGRELKNPFPQFGNGKGMKKPIPIIREREGNEKKAFPKFGKRKGLKKSVPIIRERESEAFILGNGRDREFPLTPDHWLFPTERQAQQCIRVVIVRFKSSF